MSASPTETLLSGLRCLRCGRTFMVGSIDYVCPCRPNQGSDLGHLDAVYEYDAIDAMRNAPQDPAYPGYFSLLPSKFLSTGHTIERWWPLLPVNPVSLPPLPVGNTPLLRANRLGEAIRVPKLYVKDDGRNPSGSFKDRASAVAVARARETGREVVATASTGNAAAALAAMSAAAAHSAVIFVPRSAPQAKIAQLLVYGSRVLAVDGTYDDAFDLCVRACDEFGWYNRNTGYNPFMTEGKKTVSFEIAAQLAERNAIDGYKGSDGHSPPLVAPDCVFVSVGDGSIIGGVFKGFWEMHTLGWIDRIPRIFGIQSTASAAIHDAWRDDLEVPRPVAAATAADSISVNAPRDATKALRAVRASGGAFLLVEDEAILEAILPLARLGGVFAEPAGATALAGLQLAQRKELLEPGETVVVISTGSGLKDVPAAMRVAGEPAIISPTLEAVAENLNI